MIKMAAFFFSLTLAFNATIASAQSLEAVVDWSRWDAILHENVIDGRVDYGAIAADPGFTATVADIANADLAGHDRESLLAFSINAYNVLAVKGILDGHSPASSFGKLRFFYRDKYTVAGEPLSLHAFEKEHIRTLDEPRIHFAIVCASASCPPLRSEAYLPQTLDQQLDHNARRFLTDSAKNRYDLDSRAWPRLEDIQVVRGGLRGRRRKRPALHRVLCRRRGGRRGTPRRPLQAALSRLRLVPQWGVTVKPCP